MSNNTINAIHRYLARCKPQEPPAFIELYAMWKKEDKQECLRFGQWFYNRFIGGGLSKDIQTLVDKLHAEPDIRKCQDMIEELYKNYQWPMA